MKKEKIKVYTYKRVSTTMQIDGYFTHWMHSEQE